MVNWYSSSSTTATYGDYINQTPEWTIARTKKAKKAKMKTKEPAVLKKFKPVYFDPKDLYL